jgi:hypothetical protein
MSSVARPSTFSASSHTQWTGPSSIRIHGVVLPEPVEEVLKRARSPEPDDHQDDQHRQEKRHEDDANRGCEKAASDEEQNDQSLVPR